MVIFAHVDNLVFVGVRARDKHVVIANLYFSLAGNQMDHIITLNEILYFSGFDYCWTHLG